MRAWRRRFSCWRLPIIQPISGWIALKLRKATGLEHKKVEGFMVAAMTELDEVKEESVERGTQHQAIRLSLQLYSATSSSH